MLNQYLFRFSVTTLVIFVVSFTIEGNTYSTYSSSPHHYYNPYAPCTKCGPQPPDCTNSSTPPFNGGPACSCSTESYVHGCTLKPCTSDSIFPCDCYQSTDPTKYCHHLRCNGANGACETCDATYPPDCVAGATPPKEGGAPCVCVPNIYPDGCTLAPCRNDGSHPQVCVCQPGVSVYFCMNPRCPGSSKNATTSTSTTSTTNVATTSKGFSVHGSKATENFVVHGPSALDFWSAAVGSSSVDNSKTVLGSNAVDNSKAVHSSIAMDNSKAVLGSNTVLGSNPAISPNSVENSNAVLSSNTVLGSNAVLGSNSVDNSKAIHSSNPVNSLASLLNLNVLSSNGHQNSGILGTILGG